MQRTGIFDTFSNCDHFENSYLEFINHSHELLNLVELTELKLFFFSSFECVVSFYAFSMSPFGGKTNATDIIGILVDLIVTKCRIHIKK